MKTLMNKIMVFAFAVAAGAFLVALCVMLVKVY
jgi:hypothetical protein